MQLKFYRGTVKAESSGPTNSSWARMGNEILGLRAEVATPLERLSEHEIVSEHEILTIDLPGLDSDHGRTVVENVLRGSYLDKPGVSNKGDAVVYVVVNEAIHAMKHIARQENLEGDDTPGE